MYYGCMPHSHKLLLILAIALVVSFISAYLFLSWAWFQGLLPVQISPAATRFSVFAVFFIFIFDFLVLMVEQVDDKVRR